MEIKNVIVSWFLSDGIPILLIIIVALVINSFLNGFFKRLFKENNPYAEEEKRLNTFYSLMHSFLRAVIFIIALLLILDELKVNIKPILAAAGVAGVAVGFGAQRFIEDIISGIIIVLNHQIRVGDVVKIGNIQGYVEKITLNMIVLRDMEGCVHFIRNGKIDVVSNMTKEYSYYVTDISVAYKEDIERVIDVIKIVGEKMLQAGKNKEDILEPIEVFGLDKFDDSAIVIKARIKTKAIKQWAVGREFNLLLKKEFDSEGIEMPFPQCKVHLSEK